MLYIYIVYTVTVSEKTGREKSQSNGEDAE